MRDKNGTAIYDCLEPHISKFGDTWFVCVYCVVKMHDLNETPSAVFLRSNRLQ